MWPENAKNEAWFPPYIMYVGLRGLLLRKRIGRAPFTALDTLKNVKDEVELFVVCSNNQSAPSIIWGMCNITVAVLRSRMKRMGSVMGQPC